MKTYLVTGATSGLGLQIALQLAGTGDARLILPVRDAARGEQLRRDVMAAGAARADTQTMDLASLKSVADYLDILSADATLSLDGVLLNAGMQAANQLAFTRDGYETSFAVNHLAHYLLMEGLLPYLADGARVGWTASGTHDPKESSARMAGFRGARYTSAARLAQGDYGTDTSPAQACKDAYATSKFCEMVSARLFAERMPEAAFFFSFDPGLMPGTGLARQHGRVGQFVWRHVMTRLARVMPGTSTPQRSAAIVVDLLIGRLRSDENGAYFNYTGGAVEPAPMTRDPQIAADLRRESDAMLRRFKRND